MSGLLTSPTLWGALAALTLFVGAWFGGQAVDWARLRRRATAGRSTIADLARVLDRYTGKPARRARTGSRHARSPLLRHGDRATVIGLAARVRPGIDPHDSRTWTFEPPRGPVYPPSTFITFLLATEDPHFLLVCLDAGIGEAELRAHARGEHLLDRAGVKTLAALRRDA